MEFRSSAMSADPTTDAMSVTKNRMAPFEAGTKKKLRSRAWPGKKAPKKRTKTMELTRTKPTPTAVATIVAGRLNSRRNPVTMIARSRCRRPRSGISRRVYVGSEIDIYAPRTSFRWTSSRKNSSRLRISRPMYRTSTPRAFAVWKIAASTPSLRATCTPDDVASASSPASRSRRANASRSPRTSIRKRSAEPLRSWLSSPAAIWCPPSRITMYLQIVSTSGRRWLDKTTLRPGERAITRTRSSISVRPRGSRPVVGSSKMYSCGSWTIAWASLIFCFMPVEYSATLRYRSSSTPTNCRTSCERLIAVSRSRPLIRAMYETSPTPVMSGMRQSCSGMYPIRSCTGTPSSMSRPRTFAVPAVGRTRLSRSRRNVVLPAPFGPTRPMAPSGILTVKSSTARTSPNTFVSPAVSTSTIFPSDLLAVLGGRSGRRCMSSDSSFAAPPEEDHHEGDDRDRQHDEQEDLRRADSGRRTRAVRVRPEAHLGRGRAVLVRRALNVESDVVREVRGLVAAGEAARKPWETPEGLIEFVRGERARLDADVLAGEDVAMPRRRDVRHVLRRHRLEERGEGGVQLHD